MHPMPNRVAKLSHLGPPLPPIRFRRRRRRRLARRLAFRCVERDAELVDVDEEGESSFVRAKCALSGW
jgi:hypothetical protein